jgi:hypothetical protein
MKKVALLIAICFSMGNASAQNVAINNTASPADASAMLDVSSNTKGMLVPRMTQAQRVAISNPANGLLIYQTDLDSGFYFNAGNASIPKWIPVQSQLTDGAQKEMVEQIQLVNF